MSVTTACEGQLDAFSVETKADGSRMHKKTKVNPSDAELYMVERPIG